LRINGKSSQDSEFLGLKLGKHVVFTFTTFSTFEVEVIDNMKNYIIFSSQQALHDGPDHFFPQQFHELAYEKRRNLNPKHRNNNTNTMYHK
jgi:hypothetical protein